MSESAAPRGVVEDQDNCEARGDDQSGDERGDGDMDVDERDTIGTGGASGGSGSGGSGAGSADIRRETVEKDLQRLSQEWAKMAVRTSIRILLSLNGHFTSPICSPLSV